MVTEGEIDALTVMELQDCKYPVVSLGHGASAAKKTCAANYEYFDQFEQIISMFDMDDAGRKAAQECLRIYPAAKVAPLPTKDVNDGLIAGRSKAVKEAVLFKAETPKNTRLVQGASLHHVSKEPAKWGLPWPWKGINKTTAVS